MAFFFFLIWQLGISTDKILVAIFQHSLAKTTQNIFL
eukprot:UN06150